MRKLWIKFLLWNCGYCAVHGKKRVFPGYAPWKLCADCMKKVSDETVVKKAKHQDYLDGLIKEWNQ